MVNVTIRLHGKVLVLQAASAAKDAVARVGKVPANYAVYAAIGAVALVGSKVLVCCAAMDAVLMSCRGGG